MLLYIAGKYRGDVEANIEAAKQVAAECFKVGHDVICPHMNTAKMDEVTDLPDEFWLQTTLNLLMRCDGIVMVPGWEESTGARAEKDYAERVKIPVYYAHAIPPLHPTEVRCPVQVKAFLESVMTMYRTHLSKNQDYSPMNILGTGELGVAVRLWDKVARLLNLLGFRISAEFIGFDASREPQHESIQDTYLDSANYSVIGSLVRRGVWGK